jgi:hypothetical protein
VFKHFVKNIGMKGVDWNCSRALQHKACKYLFVTDVSFDAKRKRMCGIFLLSNKHSQGLQMILIDYQSKVLISAMIAENTMKICSSSILWGYKKNLQRHGGLTFGRDFTLDASHVGAIIELKQYLHLLCTHI